jgi:hypothetical protein
LKREGREAGETRAGALRSAIYWPRGQSGAALALAARETRHLRDPGAVRDVHATAR